MIGIIVELTICKSKLRYHVLAHDFHLVIRKDLQMWRKDRLLLVFDMLVHLCTQFVILEKNVHSGIYLLQCCIFR